MPMIMVVVVAMVAMTVRSMHMAVGDFLLAGGTHIRHVQREAQRNPCQRMISVQDDVAIRNIGHRENQRLIGVAGIVRRTLELHADLQRLGQPARRFDLYQIGVILPECIFRLDLDAGRIPGLFSIERLLDLGQGVAISAVQINHRLAAFLYEIALGIGELVMQCDDRILGNLHGGSFLKVCAIIACRGSRLK